MHNIRCETAKSDKKKCKCSCKGEFHGKAEMHTKYKSLLTICETEFENRDPQNPDYSLTEIDYYANGKYPDSHRLSLRKNMKTNQFEVYRHFYRTKRDEVVYSSADLKSAVLFACRERANQCGFYAEDTICDHNRNISAMCKIRNR